VADENDSKRDDDAQGTSADDATRDDAPDASSGDDTAQDAGRDNDNDGDIEAARKLRSESRTLRKRLREAEAARDEAVAERDRLKGDVTDEDRQRQLAEASERATRLASQLRRVALRAEIGAQARSLKLADVDTALALLDGSDDIEWADDEPTADSVKDALKGLLDSKPFLVVAEASDAPGTVRSGSGGSTGPGTGGKPARESDDERRARIHGGGQPSIFDPDVARARGGGVIA
jgi:hypothetical protein